MALSAVPTTAYVVSAASDNRQRVTARPISRWWQPSESSGWVMWLAAHSPTAYNYLYPYVSLVSLLSLCVAIAIHFFCVLCTVAMAKLLDATTVAGCDDIFVCGI